MTYVHYKNSADNSWAVRNKAVFIPIPCGVETRKLRLTIRNASHGCIGFRMNRCASRSDWLWSSAFWDLPRNSRGRRPTHTVVYLLAKRPAKAIGKGEWNTTGREQRQSSSSGGPSWVEGVWREQVLGLKGPPAMNPSPTYLCRRES